MLRVTQDSAHAQATRVADYIAASEVLRPPLCIDLILLLVY